MVETVQLNGTNGTQPKVKGPSQIPPKPKPYNLDLRFVEGLGDKPLVTLLLMSGQKMKCKILETGTYCFAVVMGGEDGPVVSLIYKHAVAAILPALSTEKPTAAASKT